MASDFYEMQLAPDGKIYITKGSGQADGTKYLGIIENPNDPANSIIASELGLYLGGTDAFIAPTPTFIQNYFFKTSFSFPKPCSGEPVHFKVTNEAGLDSVRWDFGPENFSTALQPYYTFDEPGEYDVTLLAFYPYRTDTIRKQVTVLPSPVLDLGLETTVCFGHKLSVAEGFNSYLWNTGDSSRSILITQPGNYILTVENEHSCFTNDSVFLHVAELPVIELPDSMQLGTNDSILVDATYTSGIIYTI